jgi:DNA-binding protein HU-beta
MNKSELIKQVANKTGMSKKESEKAVAAIIESITEKLGRGDKVRLIGFGTFEVRSRKERLGFNPATGGKILIKALKVPAFKPSKPLKRKVSLALGPRTGGGPGTKED